MQSRFISSCNSIKTFDFSTLYTTIPHSKLKDNLRDMVQLCFYKNNSQRRYEYLVLRRDKSYLVKSHSGSIKKRFSETYIIKMLNFFIDNIFVGWWTCFSTDSRHIYIISPHLADLFLYSYEGDFIQGILKKNEMKLARSFNFTFRYIDDILSLNNCKYAEFVHSIYPIHWAWNKGYHRYN